MSRTKNIVFVAIIICLLASIAIRIYVVPKSDDLIRPYESNQIVKAIEWNESMEQIDKDLIKISESYERMEIMLDEMNAQLIDILCEVCRRQGYDQAMEELGKK